MTGPLSLTYPAPDHLFGYNEDKLSLNAERATREGLEPCTHCGRGVKPGSGWLVVVVDGGASVLRADVEPDLQDSGYMGAWILGSTCAKQIPRDYRAQWTGWDD